MTTPQSPATVARYMTTSSHGGMVKCIQGGGGDWVSIVDYASLYARWLVLSMADPAPVWIPCSECMPEPDQTVLTWSEYGGVQEHKWDSGKYLKKPVCKWHRPSGRMLFLTPTHWMPMPKPPGDPT